MGSVVRFLSEIEASSSSRSRRCFHASALAPEGEGALPGDVRDSQVPSDLEEDPILCLESLCMALLSAAPVQVQEAVVCAAALEGQQSGLIRGALAFGSSETALPRGLR